VLLGSAAKEGKPLGTVHVSLYSAGKVIFKATRLHLEGLGNFNLQVVPPKTRQQVLYGFGTINGYRERWSDYGLTPTGFAP
jgi:hypothetical protein